MFVNRHAVAICGAAVALALGPAIGLGNGTQTYTDPTGDAGTGLDISGATVSNDNAGRITFAISVPGLQAIPPGAVVVVALDTDANPATGCNGAEYALATPGSSVLMTTCAGGAFGAPTTPLSAAVAVAPGVVSISIDRKDVGSPDGFLFGLGTVSTAADGSADPANVDIAPNVGDYAYRLALGPPRLAVTAPGVLPAHLIAGHGFVAGMAVHEGAAGLTPDPASGGTVRCRCTVAGKAVRAAGAIRRDRVTCRGRVPSAALGKTLRGTVTFTYKGATASRSFAARVR